jgi:hemerythrin-like domain-containing protein
MASDNSSSPKAGDSLRPSQVRRIILEEHGEIRKQMNEIDRLVKAKDLKGLAPAIKLFQKTFIAHLAHEETIVWPILRTVDSWGPVRIDHMTKEHKEQRQIIDGLSYTKEEDLVEVMKNLIGLLVADMIAEEKDFLNPDLLRDDVVTSGFGG